MCIGGGSSAPPPPDTSAQDQQMEKEQQTAKEQKAKTLERRVRRIRGGTGRRSLITGSGGGMGYYNEYL